MKPAQRKLSQYEKHYTWSHKLGDHCIAHKDGAVSTMIVWQGLDSVLLTDGERLNIWANFYLLLNSLSDNYCYEFHFWRQRDSELAKKYIDKNKDITRSKDFASQIRINHANHLSRYSFKNKVAVVITRLPNKSPFLFFTKAALTRQSKLSQDLVTEAIKISRSLTGARLASFDEYRQAIFRSFDHLLEDKPLPDFNPQFLMTEQTINEAPLLSDGMVKLRDSYVKVLLLYMYPNSSPAWFNELSGISATIHISQIILPTDTQAQMAKSEREQDLVEGMASKRGRYTTAKGLSDLAAYQRLIADENLSIFRNAFIIHIGGTDIEQITAIARDIEDWVTRGGGVIKDQDYIQLPYFRTAQPGQGYRCPTFRPDHTWQVADMLPVQVYDGGDQDPESLRLGTGSQLIGFNISNQAVSHSFTAAMTGGGKGVDKGATILETFPFGVDWYIAEVGESYRWTVEGLGGVYSTIDPDKDVVNPLPPFNVANPSPDYDTGELPLDSKVVGGTIKALGFLLTDGNASMNQHEKAAAQLALQGLYVDLEKENEAPTLFDYFEIISTADFFENKEQLEAAKRMSANLESFLSTTEGKIFTKQDNLVLSPGITGVNLKEVESASKELLQFYLVFLSLRYSQLAFFNTNNSRILLDEMHKFVAISPEVIGALISAVARMGRKDAGYIDLVTQGIVEIDVIEKEVLNSMPLRTLLYRPDGHDEIAERVSMPDGLLPIWKSYPYPIQLDYRPGLRSVGDAWYDLHLTFNKDLLALVDTSDLALKNKIATQTSDPMERIALFYSDGEI